MISLYTTSFCIPGTDLVRQLFNCTFDAPLNLFTYLSLQLIIKMSPNAPPKILVERYLMEIARNYNVQYEPDAAVMLVSGHFISFI